MPSPAEQFFDAAAELGRAISDRRRAERLAAKDARNARRRARYAATKHLRPARQPVSLEEPDYEPECRCRIVPMPPCTYCENYSDDA